MNIRSKIVRYNDELESISKFQRGNGVSICLTTGCFDVLHRGHVELLGRGRELGDLLFVGINSDEAIRELKGPTRPVNTLEDRMLLLASIEYVSLVFPIHSTRVGGVFKLVKPSVWLKGGDYSLDTLDALEVAAAREFGAEISIMKSVEGCSTTAILNRQQQ